MWYVTPRPDDLTNPLLGGSYICRVPDVWRFFETWDSTTSSLLGLGDYPPLNRHAWPSPAYRYPDFLARVPPLLASRDWQCTNLQTENRELRAENRELRNENFPCVPCVLCGEGFWMIPAQPCDARP
jgi:hypothetical protein